MKLTKAQIAILDRMASGDEVWTVTGRYFSAFWHNHLNDRAPNWRSMEILRRAGLIEPYGQSIAGHQYRITPAGREALAQHNGDGE